MINVFKTSIEDVKAYRDFPAVSQSYLKDLDKSLDSFLEQKEKSNTLEMTKGSMTDCILTGQEGDFEKCYYISDKNHELSDVEMAIINLTFSTIIARKLEIAKLENHIDILKEAIMIQQWYKGDPGDKRILTLIEKSEDYFQELNIARTKTIIKKDTNIEVENMVKSLRENPLTALYFNPDNYEELLSFCHNSVSIDIYYQLPIFFTFDNEPCKALLDELIVFKDKDGLVIGFIVADLKTTSMYTLDFASVVTSFRYDIQAAFYMEAVSNFIQENYRENYKENIITIRKFIFIVNSFKKSNPIIFETDQEFLKIGKYGIRTSYKKLRGFLNLLDLHKYYVKNEWKQDKLIEENNGVLTLTFNNVFKIYED
jgi:hypothetical protein